MGLAAARPVSGCIVTARHDAHLAVTIDHRGKRNALSEAMWHQLGAVFSEVAQDAALLAVTVRGAAGHFAAGADMSEFARLRFDAESGRR